MKRSIYLATLTSSILTSASFAGFNVFVTRVPSGVFDRFDIVAINTGGDTGTQIKGLEYFYQGSPVSFEVNDADENGTPDTVNLLSTSRTRVRVATSTNTYVGLNPVGQDVEPNPYLNPLSAFSGAIANTGTTQATGTGFQIARLFLPTGGSFVFSGNLGGDVGSKVPFSVGVHTDPPPGGIQVTHGSANVVFGQIVTNGAPFSLQIQATTVEPGAVLSLAVGALPAGVSNLSVSPATSGSPANFTVSGLVDYSLNGTTVNVPFTVSSATDTVSGQFAIAVTPEPASIAALGMLLCLNRKRKVAG